MCLFSFALTSKVDWNNKNNNNDTVIVVAADDKCKNFTIDRDNNMFCSLHLQAYKKVKKIHIKYNYKVHTYIYIFTYGWKIINKYIYL